MGVKSHPQAAAVTIAVEVISNGTKSFYNTLRRIWLLVLVPVFRATQVSEWVLLADVLSLQCGER